MTTGPFALVRRMAAIFDELGVSYALGGSLASSLIGEPRSTVDVDMAVSLDVASGDKLLERVGAEFYVPTEVARQAIRNHSSFNLIDTANALKVDIFVVGDGLLDRMQLERRFLVEVPGVDGGIWVTSAEDQVLRKLDWYRQGGSVSDRQWRDVVGILRVQGAAVDLDYLTTTAQACGMSDDLGTAMREAAFTD
jgi:hypothetical protein